MESVASDDDKIERTPEEEVLPEPPLLPDNEATHTMPVVRGSNSLTTGMDQGSPSTTIPLSIFHPSPQLRPQIPAARGNAGSSPVLSKGRPVM